MELKINGALLKSNCINGIIGNYNLFIDDFKKLDFDSNNIIIDKKRLTKKEKLNLFKTISIVDDNIFCDYSRLTVYGYMKLYMLDNYLETKDYRKKIKDSLKIVGLKNYDDRLFDSLSSSEVKMVLFATALLSNPNIIILNNYFSVFDLKYRKKILDLLNQLKDKYNKIIVICSNDSEFIYKYTNNLICIKNNKILTQGKTSDLFEEETLKLISNSISIPKTILFTNLVIKKKGVKLNYNMDIRDLIKDIYKKV